MSCPVARSKAPNALVNFRKERHLAWAAAMENLALNAGWSAVSR